MLPELPLLLAFVGASLVLALTPGPADVLAASLIGPRVARATRHAAWGNRIAGTSFIGLGVLTALGHRPTSH